MRILLKYPTRSRPQQFLKTLMGWIKNASAPADLAVLVSYDADDDSMTPEVITNAEMGHPAVVCVQGRSKTKIEACNADLNEYAGDWDVVLLVSDDMWCVRTGWDELIRGNMLERFPDTDGVLWFHDGSKQREIMTLSCVGRKYYERDHFIYHGSYASFWCDNEATNVALARGKLAFIDQPIANHQHPAWLGGMKRDALYIRNNAPWKADETNYHRRKALGFPD